MAGLGHWKPEHRAAFLLCVPVGAAIGLAAGYFLLAPADLAFAEWIRQSPQAPLCGGLGAVLLSAVVYAWREVAGSEGFDEWN
jgi:hypothetical protein